jgi:transposase
MEDNASVYKAKYTQAWHVYHGLRKMFWPANSPDLNLIEDVWRLLKYQVSRRFPKTIDELCIILYEEWDKLLPEDHLKYIGEMPKRVKAVYGTYGGHTQW